MHDYDGAWKEMIDRYFRHFLAFFFPDILAEADPEEDDEHLQQELRKLLPMSETGQRVVDRLVKMRTRKGDPRYLHAEIQAWWEKEFERRVHQCNSRLSDHFGQDVVSVAILADGNHDWRPDTYRFTLWGCEKTFKYPIVKVLDYADRLAELEAHDNPVALFVAAHLISLGRRRMTRRARRRNCA